MQYRGPEVLMSGPAGTGKSRACLEKLHIMALLNDGMRGLILRKTAVSMRSSILVEFRSGILPEFVKAGVVKFFSGSAQEPAQYRYQNGSVIVLGGMDTSSRIMSTQYDVIYINEAFELTEDEYETCTSRLRNGVVSFQQMIADTNPQHPTHWLNQRSQRGQTKMLYARHSDNPAYVNEDGSFTPLGDSYINGTLASLTGVRKERLFYGRWAAAEGAIWEDWDENKHLIDRAPIPRDWPRYWSIDFGYTNPFVCQIWAVDPDGRLIRDREIYHTGMLVEDHARTLKALVTPERADKPARQPKPRWIVADHDAEGRATFEKHFGQSTIAANKAVTHGIQAVASRLKVAGDDKPRLMIMRDGVVKVDQSLRDAKKPTCTEDEIAGYVWADGKKKEEPVKEDDHGCDAMRYVVAQLDTGVKSRVRIVNF